MFYLYLLKLMKFLFSIIIFYEKWNEIYENDLIEFILPSRKYRNYPKINNNKNNLIDLEVSNLLQEY